MLYGMYLSAGGALTQAARQDVIANNLANADTIGFKGDTISFKLYPADELARPDITPRTNVPLLVTGGGVLIQNTDIDFRPGVVRETGGLFDVALDGGGFLAVKRGDQTYYTRAGNMTMRPDGTLVTMDGSCEMLSTGGSPIAVPPEGTSVKIGEDGNITDSKTGAVYGKLKVVEFANLARLRKIGDNLFTSPDDNVSAEAPGTRVRQGMLEGSSVNPVLEMVNMIEAYRAYESNMRFIKMQDDELGRTVTDLARIPR